MNAFVMRGFAVENGKDRLVEMEIEFEGNRAFAVWDTVTCGRYEFKARVELDATLLQRAIGQSHEFEYRGQLVLPRPQDN